MDDDKTLKALLKEEKRRREKRREGEKKEFNENKREKSKHREHRENKEDKNREKSKPREEKREKSKHRVEKNREEKRERREKSKHREENDVISFMFIFEDSEGKLFSDLEKIEKKEGEEVKIFPVYVSGGNDNLNEETVTFTNGKYESSEENSWLTILNSKDKNLKVVKSELQDVVVYNGQFYHCMDDFIEYIELFGPDVLPLNLK